MVVEGEGGGLLTVGWIGARLGGESKLAKKVPRGRRTERGGAAISMVLRRRGWRRVWDGWRS